MRTCPPERNPEREGGPREAVRENTRTGEQDIRDLWKTGFTTVTNVGWKAEQRFEGCVVCEQCLEECPESAISVAQATSPPTVKLDQYLCNGVACRRCVRIYPERVFRPDHFSMKQH